MLVAVSQMFIPKSGRSPSRVYCIFAQLTNSNVLGKLPIRDWIWQKYNEHATLNDQIHK